MKRLSFLLLLCMVLISSLPLPVSATKWVYEFVVWNGYVYVLSEERVEDVEDEIGRVTAYSDMEELPGNFSNTYQKGTAYYSIKGTDTEEAIAVKEENGVFIKAIREKEYAHALPDEKKQEPAVIGKILLWGAAILVAALLIIVIVLIQKRLTAKSDR